jgi:hypothetical protein
LSHVEVRNQDITQFPTAPICVLVSPNETAQCTIVRMNYVRVGIWYVRERRLLPAVTFRHKRPINDLLGSA